MSNNRNAVTGFRKVYKQYVLVTLTLVYTVSYLDQQAVSLLLQPIKEDLNLSDTQLGFLTGIAFGLFYALATLPISRWADRGNRVTITALALGLWGATVMLCVFVSNFMQFALSRIAAAVGGSGCMPPSYSLVGDYFAAPRERTRAMTIFMLAGPLSGLISFIVGGWLNEAYGWRNALFGMGIPGLLMAAVIKLTVAEPRAVGTWRPKRPVHSLVEVLATVWRQSSLFHMSVAIVLVFTMGLGLSAWFAAFLARNHGMGTADIGVWLGVIFGLGGAAGILMGGYIAGRWFAENEGGQMRLTAVMIALVTPCDALFLLLSRKECALMALVPAVVVSNVFFGPTFAILQRLVVEETRATTVAVILVLYNLIGLGIGPQFVGMLSDWLKPLLGADSLRYAMLAMSSLALWSAYHFWKAGQTVSGDLLMVANFKSGQTPEISEQPAC